MSRSEYEDDQQAELGYRHAGQREVRQREWFSLRGEPDEPVPTPKAFKKLVNVLRVTKWAKENPERRKAIANRYARKPGVAQHQAELSRQKRNAAYRASGLVLTCQECGSQFTPIKPPRGVPRLFCTERCGYLNLQRRERREAGRRETSCRVCGASGHNARRHA